MRPDKQPGFLFRVEGETGLVAVAGPPAAAEKGLTVVFNPGQRDERPVPAERVAADAQLGLALVRVTGKLPRPIDGAARPVLAEKSPVFLLGFTATDDKVPRPATAVVKVGVALPKATARDEAAPVSLDKTVLDLLVGGPVVDARGRLVGIAVQPAGQARGSAPCRRPTSPACSPRGRPG